MSIDLKNLTIKKVHRAFIGGEYSAVDLVKAYIDEIKKRDKDIHAYLEVYPDILEQAKEADKVIKSGKAGLLTGIPIAIKDNILIKGRKVTSASKILENYTATYDATVIEKLKKEGAVFIGRTNMDEFAMGGSTENSAYGPTKNPIDPERVPGGSSGGSAAVVAGNMALVALGSDTGGSVRQPASFCGLVGLKPTYGAVSRYGLMAMASSFDQISPIAKTVEDVKIVFDVINGVDRMDSTSVDFEKKEDKKESKKIKIGFIKELNIDQTVYNEDVFKNVNELQKKLKEEGYKVEFVELPNLKYALATYYTLVPAEVSSNMARYDGMRFGKRVSGKDGIEDYFLSRQAGLGREVRRRIILGTYVLSAGYYDAYYNKANIVRNLIREDYKKAFKKVDVIITPTTPGPAFKIGEKIDDPLQLYLEDIFTVPINLAGVPAISIPYGIKNINGKDLPLGVQLIANHGDEETLFNLAKAILGELD